MHRRLVPSGKLTWIRTFSLGSAVWAVSSSPVFLSSSTLIGLASCWPLPCFPRRSPRGNYTLCYCSFPASATTSGSLTTTCIVRAACWLPLALHLMWDHLMVSVAFQLGNSRSVPFCFFGFLYNFVLYFGLNLCCNSSFLMQLRYSIISGRHFNFCSSLGLESGTSVILPIAPMWKIQTESQVRLVLGLVCLVWGLGTHGTVVPTGNPVSICWCRGCWWGPRRFGFWNPIIFGFPALFFLYKPSSSVFALHF